jgi:para-nitrobenzyl esterase
MRSVVSQSKWIPLADLGGSGYESSGNIGMLDIVAALEWVRNNIEGFGGDPRNVTVFGQSGSGGKVARLCGMPAAKGLFHRGIDESGARFLPVAREVATLTAEGFLAALNLDRSQVPKLHEMPYEATDRCASCGTTLSARSRGFLHRY